MTAVRADQVEIRRALELILSPGQVTELRAIGATTPSYKRPHGVSGYFDYERLDDMAKAAAQLAATGVYFIPNPVNADLLARASNRVKDLTSGDPTTADKNILRRMWLFVDADPIRATGISSTDAEHEAALARARQVRDWLTAQGWPAPMFGDSGNGGHLLYRVDLPADDGGLVKWVLEALAVRFSDGGVEIDQKVCNAARLWKLYGTVARKGDSIPERPHRMARLLDVPDTLIPVSQELLERLAATAPLEPEPQSYRNNGTFDLTKWIPEHGLTVSTEGPWHGEGYRWELEECPWNPAHKRSVVIVRLADGRIGAGCQHNSCGDKHWHDLRDVVEPGWGDRPGSQQSGYAADHGQDGAKLSRPSSATLLIGLAAGVQLFHTPESEAYATVPVAGHFETWPARSQGFKRWLTRRFYEEEKKAPPAQAMQDALNVLEAQATCDGAEFPVFTRVAEHQGNIYLDLGNGEWQAAESTPSGWQVICHAPVKFCRPRGMLSLPYPEARGTLGDELRRFINVEGEDWPLVAGWLIQAARPSGPYPVLVFHGGQGTAKSTATKVLKVTLDPAKAPLRATPQGPRDLMIAAGNGHILAYDNLSHLHPWLSDALCRVSTGGGFSTRELYSDKEEALFEAQRPLILNGIEELATRPDLLDRALILYLPEIPEDKRIGEKQFWAGFKEAHPRILGALLTAVSGALRESPRTTLSKLPRMADFALWATAAEIGSGGNGARFLSAYTENRGAANALSLDASPIAQFLFTVADEGDWTGTASDLLKKLTGLAGDEVTRQKTWPKNGKALSNAVRRISANLRAEGIEVTFERESGGNRRRIVTLKTGEKGSIFASLPSQPARTRSRGGTQGPQVGTQSGTQETQNGVPVSFDRDDRDGRDAEILNSSSLDVPPAPVKRTPFDEGPGGPWVEAVP